jgi:hypothetical protein
MKHTVAGKLATYEIALGHKEASSDYYLGAWFILLMSCRTTTRLETTTVQRR